MDLNDPMSASGPRTAAAMPLAAGHDHSALENDGPKAFGDRMGTPQSDETVLWKGRPQVALLARTAFHTRTFGLYMIGLTVVAIGLGKTDAALVAAVLGAVLIALLYLLAWATARSTLYILTDTRMIMRIGTAIETRVNIPLKQVTGAHLRMRGQDHGDIAFELSGERLLGNLLLWPHVRPWHYAMPQPMLRAVPDAGHVAEMIAEARARFGSIDRHVSAVKAAAPTSGQTMKHPSAVSGRLVPVLNREQDLEGAPA